MSAEELKGVVINGKVISAVVGVFTIVAMLFGAVSYVTYQSFELAQAKADIVKLDNKVDTQVAKVQAQIDATNLQSRKDNQLILDKMDNLTGKIAELTIAVGNIQYRQDNTKARQ